MHLAITGDVAHQEIEQCPRVDGLVLSIFASRSSRKLHGSAIRQHTPCVCSRR